MTTRMVGRRFLSAEPPAEIKQEQAQPNRTKEIPSSGLGSAPPWLLRELAARFCWRPGRPHKGPRCLPPLVTGPFRSREPERDVWGAPRAGFLPWEADSPGWGAGRVDPQPSTMLAWGRWAETEGQAQGAMAKRFRDLPRPRQSWGRGSASDVCPSGPAQRRREECTPAAQLGGREEAGLQAS